MCKAASMILLQDRVLIGNVTNSHTEILEQHGIEDVELEPNFVKIEITPPLVDDLSNYYAPLSEWEYKVDQDYLPDWYIPEYDEGRVREELVRWYREHIEMQHTDSPDVFQKAGNHADQVAGFSATQIAGNNANQEAGSKSNQEAGDNVKQEANYNAHQIAGNHASQKAGDESFQKAKDYANQEAGNNANQVAEGNATQVAGRYASQVAGTEANQEAGGNSTQCCWNDSKQKAGVGTVQIGRWTDINGDTKVATRVITEEEAYKWYYFENGVWTLIK